jgi:hypothetical protein
MHIGGEMTKRRRARAVRALLAALISAGLIVITGVVAVGPAQAAATGAESAGRMALDAADASASTPCVVSINAPKCQSTNPDLTVDVVNTGDTSACIFTYSMSWGDGSAAQQVTFDGAPQSGEYFLATHTYHATQTQAFSITASPVSITGGNCNSGTGSYTFTLDIGGAAPAAPSNLTVTAVDPHDIKLNWHDNSNDEAGFEINNGVVSKDAGANSTTYTWGGLAPGTYMCFRIRAYSNAGDSAWDPNVSPWYACATTPKNCPTVLLGLHGMNEGPSSTKKADISSTVESTFVFFESIAAKAHKFRPNDYQVQDVSYPTTGFAELDNPIEMRTIVSDVVDGSRALQAAVQHYMALCSTSKFELVGYSEGAWVVNYWLHFHQGEARNDVKAIQLYGDPNYYEVYLHNRHGVYASQGLSRLAGLTFGWYGPPYPNPHTKYPEKTVCISKDPVCGKGYTDSLTEHALQFGAAAACLLTNCPHVDYVIDGYTLRGAEFLAKYAF